MSLSGMTLVKQPEVEPLNIKEVKAAIGIEHEDDDYLIASLISAAREACEAYTGRALITQTWTAAFDEWSWPYVELPRPPMQMVTDVTLYHASGVNETLEPDDFITDIRAIPGRVMLKKYPYGVLSSDTLDSYGVTYQCGYGSDPTSVPDTLKRGILLLTSAYYENRDAEVPINIPASVKALWQHYRIHTL